MQIAHQEGGRISRISSKRRETATLALSRMCRSVIVRVRKVSSGLISMMTAPFLLEMRGMSHAGVTCAEVPMTRRAAQFPASASASSCVTQGTFSPNRTRFGLRIFPHSHFGGIPYRILSREG